MLAPAGALASIVAGLNAGINAAVPTPSCRNTVRRYLRQGGWQPNESPSRIGRPTEHAEWLA